MTEAEYITNSQGIADRYTRICTIITALENQQIAVIANSDVQEYSLNDGQTVIKTVYRSPDSIAKAIEQYEKIKNRIHAQMTGQRVMRLADAGSIQSNGRRNANI